MTGSTALRSAVDVESLIDDYHEAWSGTDEDLILSYYADEVVLQIPGLLLEGKQAVRDQFVRPFITAFHGGRHQVKNLVFGPGVVTVEFSFEARHEGPFASDAAIGAPIKLPGCAVYQYDSATRQITAGRLYFDTGRLLETVTDVTVNDKDEEALRLSERNLNLTLNTIPTFIQVSRPDGTVLSVNQAVLDYHGITLADVQKEDFRTRFYHPDDVARLRQVRQEGLNRPRPFEYEQRALGKDGQYRWFLVRYNPLLDEQGRIYRWYATAFDIEDRKRAESEREQSEAALRKALDDIQSSQAKLRQVIDAIPALAWCNLPDGPNEFLNKGWHAYTGLSPEQSQGWGWQAAFHPDDLAPLMEKWMRMLTSGESDEIEARLRRHDGVYRWFLIRAEPFRDESGTIVRWYGTSTDIDDRKRAEALLSGEKRLLEMVASGCSLPDILDVLCRFVEDIAGGCYCGIYLIDPSGTTFHNAAAPTLPHGFNDPIEGARVDRETGPCGMAACLKTQVIASDLASDPRWSRSFCPLALAHGLRSCWSTPILSLSGDVLGTFAIYQNDPASPTALQQDLIARFTHIASIAIERAHGEAALKRSEAILAEAQQLSLTGSFTWRVATDDITWSEELYRIYEINIGEPVTLELIRTRVHPDDVSLLEQMKKVHQAGCEMADFEWQYRLLMPNGSIKHMHAIAHATTDQDGQLEYIAAVQDVTESIAALEALNRARSELAHMARVTTLSALTASIAHEINQPIAAVITSADACSRWLNRAQPEVQRAREAASRIEEDGLRAAEIINRLKSFYRKDLSPEREPLSINNIVDEMLRLLRSEAAGHSVVMGTDLRQDLPLRTGDRVLLQQVLMNLMLNGMEAMSHQGGELKITTQLEDGEVMVSVSDTGVGIPADKMEDIFYPFFTTKPRGTGMGLAISRTIIESHGGRLWATANQRGGATFHFTVPA